MKKTLTVISVVAAHLCVASGQDLSWTFQWGANRYGLIFEATNLSSGAKGAIRGDMEHVLSYVPKNETEFYIFKAGDSYYGEYVGRISWPNDQGVKPFPLSVYSVFGNTNYYHVSESESAEYLAGIALTNQYREAVAAVPGWIAAKNGATTNTMSCAEYVDGFWFEDLERVATTNDLSPRDYLEGIAEFQNWQSCLPVSILDFEQFSENGSTRLALKVRNRNVMSGSIVTMGAIYVDGKWRNVGSK